MSWSNYTHTGVRVAASNAESSRFGCAVVRVDIGDAPPSDVAAALESTGGDVLIVRFDARRRDVPSVLASSGRRVLPAGTLTYWERAVEDVEAASAGPDLEVVPIATLGDAGREVVAGIVRDSFTAYPNHYAVNPLFDTELAAAGYVEWALTRVSDESGTVLVLVEGSTPIGVATMVDLGTELEIELAGLVTDAQGRGAYGTLLEACVQAARAAGKDRVVISTQSDNVRVQRAWIRAGFKPFAAVETAHLLSGADPLA